MPKTIYDVTLAELMPPGMTKDPKIAAACAAFDAMAALTAAAIQKVSVLDSIAGQDGDVTDALAVQMHVDYYNQALDLAIRRSLVQNSGAIHKIKGTPGAVERVARLVFGSAQVQEWFEYGGAPYHFRVLINEFPDSDSQMGEVNRAVASAQNARSVLDEVQIIAATAQGQLYAAGVVQMAVRIALTQKPIGG